LEILPTGINHKKENEQLIVFL